MRFIRAAVSEVISLFVSDWSQAIGIMVILAAGYLGTRTVHSPYVGFAIALALCVHLVFTAVSESRRRVRTKRVVAAPAEEPVLMPGAGS